MASSFPNRRAGCRRPRTLVAPPLAALVAFASFTAGCGGADGILPAGDAIDAGSARRGVPLDAGSTDPARTDGARVDDATTPGVGAPDGGAVITPSADSGTPNDATTGATPEAAVPDDAIVDGAAHDASGGSDGAVMVCIAESRATTCAGKACGPAVDNCGRMVACPNTCSRPNTCGGGGVGANACGCSGRAGEACCAGQTCAAGHTCNNGNTCQACGANAEPCCATGSACGPGLTCDNGVCGACLAALPFGSNCTPVPVVRADASNTSPASDPQFAVDGNRCTAWSSGDVPPQHWIGRYACPASSCPNVTTVGLLTSMSSAGPVTFEIQALAPGAVFGTNYVDVYGPVTVPMADDTYYEFPVDLSGVPTDSMSAGALRVRVTSGPSSVAFREVVFLSCN